MPGPHRHLWEFYRRLIAIRRDCKIFSSPEATQVEIFRVGRLRIGGIRRWSDTEDNCIVFCAHETPVSARIPLSAGIWGKWVDSEDAAWGGAGSVLPDTIHSEGEVEMELSPYTFIVLSKHISER